MWAFCGTSWSPALNCFLRNEACFVLGHVGAVFFRTPEMKDLLQKLSMPLGTFFSKKLTCPRKMVGSSFKQMIRDRKKWTQKFKNDHFGCELLQTWAQHGTTRSRESRATSHRPAASQHNMAWDTWTGKISTPTGQKVSHLFWVDTKSPSKQTDRGSSVARGSLKASSRARSRPEAAMPRATPGFMATCLVTSHKNFEVGKSQVQWCLFLI